MATTPQTSVDTNSLNKPFVAQASVTQSQPATFKDVAPVTNSNVSQNTGQINYDTQALNSGSTVEGRMNSLMSKDNDYMKMAETQGLKQANQRGLMNSSLAVGAAEAARLNAALPIAQADASTSFQNDQTNLGYTNEQKKLNAGTQVDLAKYNATNSNELNKFNTELGVQNDQFQAQQTQANNQFNADAANKSSTVAAAEANKQNFEILSSDIKVQLAGIDQQYAIQMADIENQYKISQNLDTVMGAAYQQMIMAIADITSNKDIGEEDAANRIQALLDTVGATLEFSSGTIDVTQGPVYIPPEPEPVKPQNNNKDDHSGNASESNQYSL